MAQQPSSKFDLVERVSHLSATNNTNNKDIDDIDHDDLYDTKNKHFHPLKTPGVDHGGPDIEGGALRGGGAPNLYSRDYIGLLLQYAAVGLIYGTLPGTIYPFLMKYLNMQGTQVLSARTLVSIPWSFKVFYGIVSDCFPVCGYRRRPYMLMGWTLCFTMLLIMACSPVVDPYYPSKAVAQMDPALYTPEILASINTDAPTTRAASTSFS